MALVKPDEIHDPRVALLLEMLRARCAETSFPYDVVHKDVTALAAAQNGFHAACEVVDEWVRMKGPRFEIFTEIPSAAKDSCA